MDDPVVPDSNNSQSSFSAGAEAGAPDGAPAGTPVGTYDPELDQEPLMYMTTLQVGRVLGESFNLYFSNIIKFTLIGMIVYLPVIGLILYMTTDESIIYDPTRFLFITIALLLAGVLLYPVATGAIIYGVFRHKKGMKAGIGGCLAIALKCLPQLLGVAILVALMLTAVTVPLAVVAILLSGGTFLAIPFIVAAMIPAIMIYCGTYIASPVVVVEKRGVIESIKRSFQLTRGNRGRIFATILVINIISKIVSWTLENTLLEEELIADSLRSIQLYFFLSMAISVIFTAVTSIASALIYYNLKVGSEGADQDELASVFD